MKKKFLAVITLAMMLALSMASAAWAAGGPTSGSCGANATWSFDEASGTLTISGTGAIEDYNFDIPRKLPPWLEYSQNITSIVVQEGITSIGHENFGSTFSYGLDNLQSISLPNTLKSIGSDAFAFSCLESITIPNSVTNIDWGAFWSCSNLNSISLPNSLLTIGNDAFGRCDKLTEITIPASVTRIGETPFYACKSLSNIVVEPGNQYYVSENGFLTNKDGTTLIDFAKAELKNCILPKTLEGEIDLFNFWEIPSLKNITVPKGVKITNHYLPSEEALEYIDTTKYITMYCEGEVPEFSDLDLFWNGVNVISVKIVKVDNSKPAVTLDHSQLSVVAGSNIKFVLKATVSGKVTSDAITWSSSDTTVATVINGEITGLKGGQAIVTAALTEDADAKAECVINVKENPNNLSVYMVHFDANGGVIVGDSQAQVLDGESYTLPGATRSGYSFRGWQNGDDASNLTAAGAVYVITADTSFKAVWGSTGGGGGGGSKPSKPAKDEDTKKDDTKTETPKPAQDITPGKATMGNINTVFADVKSSSWFANAVVYVYNKGMMQGVADGQFGPNDKTTRGMIVTMLYRLEGEPGAEAAGFSDVASGQWYSSAVAWASANAVVKGYETGAFGPNDAITREQLAAILYRFAQFKGYSVETKGDLSGFADSARVADWAKEAVQWAVGSGIINGTENNELAPGANATRAEVAAMLMRFCQQFEK